MTLQGENFPNCPLIAQFDEASASATCNGPAQQLTVTLASVPAAGSYLNSLSKGAKAFAMADVTFGAVGLQGSMGAVGPMGLTGPAALGGASDLLAPVIKPGWLGTHEVTQGEDQAVVGSNPSFFHVTSPPTGGLTRAVVSFRRTDSTSHSSMYSSMLTLNEKAAR